MRARACSVALVLLAGVASADPKPATVDIKPFRDKLIVLQDAGGGTYVVSYTRDEQRLYYGSGKTLYQQIVIGTSANEDAWDVHVLAPRVEEARNASIVDKQDHTYSLFCGMHETGLTQLTGDKAKGVLDKYAFMTSAMVRAPHLIARDDHGVYYYVDKLRSQYGGKGYRVFVGRKGAMKELPLVDIATDSAGQVFATKTGELRLSARAKEEDKTEAFWSRGDKKESLIVLDEFQNSAVIFSELGVYTFTGTVCETYERH